MKAVLLALISSSLVLTLVAADEGGKKPVTIEQAEIQLEKGVQLLDVRTEKEWNEGHLDGATRVEIGAKDFVGKVKSKLDPKKPVLVYCRSGGRSARATKQLRDAGFTTVFDLDGGIIAWEEAGKALAK